MHGSQLPRYLPSALTAAPLTKEDGSFLSQQKKTPASQAYSTVWKSRSRSFGTERLYYIIALRCV